MRIAERRIIRYYKAIASGTILTIGLLSFNRPAFTQTDSDQHPGAKSSKKLSRDQIGELLRKPNGLEAAAAIEGKFVIDYQIRPWAIADLRTLVSSSALIVVGRIIDRESRLSSNGDYIDTDYTVSPEKIIKGNGPGYITFTSEGGLVEFPNGTSAEVTTVEWRQLRIGQKYLLLLSKEQDGRYYPANGLDALFNLSATDGKVDALASHDQNRSYLVLADTKNLQVEDFLSKVQALVSSKKIK